MIETYENEQFPAAVEGFDSGLLTVGYRVIAANGTVVVDRTGVGVSEDPVGSGIYVAAPIASFPEGWYRVVWDDGQPSPRWGNEDLRVYPASAQIAPPAAGYPAVGDVIAQVTGEARAYLDGLDPAQQDSLYAIALQDIESYTGQTFGGLSVETIALLGSGSDTLNLPKRLDSAQAVWIDDAPLDVTEYVVEDPMNGVLRLTRPPGSNYYERAMRDLLGPPTALWRGSVRVEGTWGWAAVPQAVLTSIRLTLEDVALAEGNELAAAIRAYERLGVKSIRQGPLSIDLAGSAPVSDRVARHLSGYVWITSVGVLA